MKYLVVVLCICMGYSCSTTSKYQKATYQNSIFSMAGVEGCTEANSGDAIDAQIGIVTCEDFTLSYDYGRYGYRGPKTLEESFEASFRAYHYTKFFELTHIDPKVQKLFIDSVQLLKVHKSEAIADSTMFDCGTCNVSAELIFKQRTYFFPTTMNEALVSGGENQGVEVVLTPSQQTKLFVDGAGKQGAVIKLTNHGRKDDYLSVSVIATGKKEADIQKILKSIQLLK